MPASQAPMGISGSEVFGFRRTGWQRSSCNLMLSCTMSTTIQEIIQHLRNQGRASPASGEAISYGLLLRLVGLPNRTGHTATQHPNRLAQSEVSRLLSLAFFAP